MSCFVLGQIVPYPHCILITSSHKVKLWEESATDEAIGMQRGYADRSLVNHQRRRAGRKRRLRIANAGGTQIKPKLKPVYKLLCTSDLSCTQGTLINEVGGEGLELEFYGFNRISSLKCI